MKRRGRDRPLGRTDAADQRVSGLPGAARRRHARRRGPPEGRPAAERRTGPGLRRTPGVALPAAARAGRGRRIPRGRGPRFSLTPLGACLARDAPARGATTRAGSGHPACGGRGQPAARRPHARSVSSPRNSPAAPAWLVQTRRRIETVFSQLTERYRAKRVRARDHWHLVGPVSAQAPVPHCGGPALPASRPTATRLRPTCRPVKPAPGLARNLLATGAMD